jgi:hypothetical protein
MTLNIYNSLRKTSFKLKEYNVQQKNEDKMLFFKLFGT